MVTRGLAWLSISMFLGQVCLILWMAKNQVAAPKKVAATADHQEPDARSEALVGAWTDFHTDVNPQTAIELALE